MLAGFGLCLGLLFVAAVFAVGSLGMRNPVKPSAPKFEEAIVVDAKTPSDGKVADGKIALIYLRGIINSASQDVRSQTFAWQSAPSRVPALIAVLHGPSYFRFPNMIAYSGQEVLVSGKLVMERATPSVIARAGPAIELTQPSQVQIVH